MEWLWLGAIAGGIGMVLLAVDLIARFAAPGAAGKTSEDEDEDEGSSFTVDDA
jgi:hypothetical protein